MELVCANWFWNWIAILHGKLNERRLSKIFSMAWYWRVILGWACERVILYMRRNYKAVTRRACHKVAVIWAGTPKRRPKISLHWLQGQGYLAVNIGLSIMTDVESCFNFLANEGSRTARMRGMQGLWSSNSVESSESLLRSIPLLWGWRARDKSRHWE